MQVNVEYRVTNLAELLEVLCMIQGSVMEAEPLRKINPAEILIGTVVAPCLNLSLSSEKLTDGSQTYNVEASA